ncbi:hypothetical protein [Flagellimonas flava]|uniref:Uncharacterized protein n=1 Tax=Flagellimonas flava TaxID=570519 RepID=A0A1M5MDL9_9FLAO|nr:hypothetical protein [Allomuricauda flava]SHG74793.1 hypothetical protein SAMN04488116_2371 [Allomuricauda flava]
MKRLVLLIFLTPFCIGAQTKMAQEAKIVVSINKGGHTIDALYFLATIKQDKMLLEENSTTKYFLGTLTGEYQVHNREVLPSQGATIKVFKDQEVFSKDDIFPIKGFEEQKDVRLGKTKATVIENKKGELILKTKNNEK